MGYAELYAIRAEKISQLEREGSLSPGLKEAFLQIAQMESYLIGIKESGLNCLSPGNQIRAYGAQNALASARMHLLEDAVNGDHNGGCSRILEICTAALVNTITGEADLTGHKYESHIHLSGEMSFEQILERIRNLKKG
jgi:hypothetical protein